ncbi:hypothetical protein Tco_0204688 [Tanacetum coccineum]
MEVLNIMMVKNINEDNRFKYHHGCKELKLTHLYFVYDLLMLCNGDADSLKVIKKSLDEFSNVSGLFPNHNKSTIFFGSIIEGKKQELLDIMPFKCGNLPMKYLGVPLLAKRLSVKDCKRLVDNSLMSWKSCLEDSCGTQLWKLIERKESLWVKWVNTIKLKNTSIWVTESTNSDSWGWKNMLLIRDKIKPFVSYKIGDGKDTSIWHDKGCNIGPLDRFITKRDLHNARLVDNAKVAEFMKNDSHEHLFFQYPYSSQIWNKMKVKSKMNGSPNSLHLVVNGLAAKPFKNNIWGILQRLIIFAVVYYVWQERILRIFQHETRIVEVLCKCIEDNVEGMLRILKVKKTSAVLDVAKIWDRQ